MEIKLLFICLISSFCLGQIGGMSAGKNNKKRSFTFHTSYNYHSLLDKNRSLVPYMGTAISVGMGYRGIKSKFRRISEFDFDYQKVFMDGKNNPLAPFLSLLYNPSSLENIRLQLMYNLIWRVKNFAGKKNNNIYVGGYIAATTDVCEYKNLGNSSFSLYAFADAGVKSEIDYTFKLFKKNMGLRYNFSLPFIAAGLRPHYSFGISDFTLQHIGLYMRFDSSLYLDFPIKNGNLISMGYRWQYQSSSGLTEFQKMQRNSNTGLVKFGFSF